MTIKACTFDVFGTCVDWRSSVENMLATELKQKTLHDRTSEVPKFAQDWRDGYSAYNKLVAAEQVSTEDFETIDIVHRRVLGDLMLNYGISEAFSDAELDDMNLIWHKLTPWPDTSEGIEMLKRKCIVSSLSNGNMRLQVDQAKFGNMRWDILLSSELYRSAKPNTKVYLGACKMLSLEPEEVCMVAAHMKDLKGAKKVGFKTAFIRRKGEGDEEVDPLTEPYIDFVVQTIGELAGKI